MREFKPNIVLEGSPTILSIKGKGLTDRSDTGFWDIGDGEIYKVLSKSNVIKIKDISEGPISGYRAGKIEYKEDGEIAIVKVGDILGTGVDWSSIDFIDESSPANTANRRINKGEILICRSGEGGARIGRLCFIHNLKFPSCVHGHVYRLKVEAGMAEYITVFLKSKFGKVQLQRYVSGVGSPALDSGDIMEIDIFRPTDMTLESIPREYERIGELHEVAIDEKAKMLSAKGHGNRLAEKKFRARYEKNIELADEMLSELIQQVEEVIEGRREEIEDVERIIRMEKMDNNDGP